jgi:hypothetical protein
MNVDIEAPFTIIGLFSAAADLIHLTQLWAEQKVGAHMCRLTGGFVRLAFCYSRGYDV